MRRLQFKFPSQIRISGWDFGSSARAMNQAGGKDLLMTYEQRLTTQADLVKVTRSTTERKIMSTKTSIKRIALVAVSTLGFGLMSAVPSQAAVGTATAIAIAKTSTDDGVALAASKYTSAPILDALAISAFSVEASSSVVLHLTAIGGTGFTAENDTRVKLRGYGIVVAAHHNAVTASGAEDPLPAFTAPSVAGTYTLDVETTTADPAAFDNNVLTYTVTMTVTAPAKVSASLSKAYIKSGDGAGAATADTDAVTASGSATAAAANRGAITMSFFNTDGDAMATGNTVTAQITSGPGYLIATTDNAAVAGTCSAAPTYDAVTGRAISAFAVDAVNTLYVCADGTAGVAKISISVTNQLATTTWASKEFTFYGAVRTLSVATSNFTIGAAGGDETGAADASRDATGEVTNAGALTAGTSTPAFIIAAKDSAGQLATAAAVPTVISSDLTVVSSGTCVLDDGATAYSSGEGFGLYNCSFTTAATAKSGDKATLTFRIADPLGTAGVDYLTTTAAVTVGDVRYTETVAFDKDSYVPGEAMVITRTAKDKSGNPVADGSSAPAVIFNKAIGGTAPAAGFYVGGVLATSSTKPAVFAPSVSGAFEARITGYNGSSAATSAIIKTATVESGSAEAAVDAANEATDAANAATDAANAAAEAADAATAAAQDAQAAVAALATSVSSLIAGIKAQITSLTNLVIKIQKKVKA